MFCVTGNRNYCMRQMYISGVRGVGKDDKYAPALFEWFLLLKHPVFIVIFEIKTSNPSIQLQTKQVAEWLASLPHSDRVAASIP